LPAKQWRIFRTISSENNCDVKTLALESQAVTRWCAWLSLPES